MPRTLISLGLVLLAVSATAACLQEPPADYTLPPDGGAPSDASTEGEEDAARPPRDAGLDAAMRAED